jgi:predicted transcriptional regulator
LSQVAGNDHHSTSVRLKKTGLRYNSGNERSSGPPEIPLLSPAEWRVFSIFSKKGPFTVRQLVAELETTPEATSSYATILTLAQRLVAKGYLTQSEEASTHGPDSAVTYSTSIPYAEALRRHAERFLAQYAFGDPDDLVLVSAVIDEHMSNR